MRDALTIDSKIVRRRYVIISHIGPLLLTSWHSFTQLKDSHGADDLNAQGPG